MTKTNSPPTGNKDADSSRSESVHEVKSKYSFVKWSGQELAYAIWWTLYSLTDMRSEKPEIKKQAVTTNQNHFDYQYIKPEDWFEYWHNQGVFGGEFMITLWQGDTCIEWVGNLDELNKLIFSPDATYIVCITYEPTYKYLSKILPTNIYRMSGNLQKITPDILEDNHLRMWELLRKKRA